MSNKPITTLEFFKEFQLILKRINTYPLSLDNLVIQRDAYSRLADLDEQNLSGGQVEPFAALEYGRKEKDTDLRFAAEFAYGCFALHIEGFNPVVFDLHPAEEVYFSDARDAAEQLITTLIMLANGQLALSVTLYNGDQCAGELIVSDYGHNDGQFVIATIPNYSRSSKSASEDRLEHVVLKNHLPFDAVPLNKQAALLFEYEAGNKIKSHGRPAAGALHKPLTYKVWKTYVGEIVEEQIGQKPGERNIVYLLRSWEFWVIGLALSIIPFGLMATHHLPKIFQDYPSLVGVILTSLAAFITVFVKEKRLGRQKRRKP
jgi:hypothetical protein